MLWLQDGKLRPAWGRMTRESKVSKAPLVGAFFESGPLVCINSSSQKFLKFFKSLFPQLPQFAIILFKAPPAVKNPPPAVKTLKEREEQNE